jgi:hypothetical protein
MLQNFSSEIISKMDAKLIEMERVHQQVQSSSRNDDEISPIVRQNSNNSDDNDKVSAKRLNVSQQEVSFCEMKEDSEDEDDYERQRRLREEQIEKDHQVFANKIQIDSVVCLKHYVFTEKEGWR